MRILIIHQNFPGQFIHIARTLADDPAHEVVGLGETRNLKGRPVVHPRIRLIGYEPHGGAKGQTHPYLRDHEGHVRRGQTVVRVLLQLKSQGWSPELILCHPGWGEGLFLKDVFPDARVVQYFEYYYDARGGDMGFDPEFPIGLDDYARVRLKNNTQLVSLMGSDEGLSPTEWQRSRFPDLLQPRIRVMHEGVDTRIVKPDPQAWIKLGDRALRLGDEVVTYVARNLEPYRGFHSFIRSLPRLQSLRPNAQVVVVGGNDVSYGRRPDNGQTYRQIYCEPLKHQVDWSRVHFVGHLPYQDYLRVLQVSAAHIYLTYPFVLSWSMLESMAAGCVVVGSDTAPVREVIRHEDNGLLVDFFDSEAIAGTLARVLEEKPQHLRDRARQTIVEGYDLTTHCLPQWVEMALGRAG
jgi:glycosyltransferase involved in cell wall biosynthesis